MATLKEVRLRQFLTQADLAQSSGIAETTICKLETGKHIPRISTMRRLARALGVLPGDIEWPTLPQEIRQGIPLR